MKKKSRINNLKKNVLGISTFIKCAECDGKGENDTIFKDNCIVCKGSGLHTISITLEELKELILLTKIKG